MAQGLNLVGSAYFRTKGVTAYRNGQWKDARFNLLRAAEHLFKLAKRTPEGRTREQHVENATRLIALAKRIDIGAPPLRGSAVKRLGEATHASAGAPSKLAEGDERKRFEQAERPSVKFSDIAGLEDVKEEVRLKILYPLLHADKAKKYGIRTGGGILLYGPPGTGKTLIAKAIAGEIEAAFFTVKPSEIMSKWVGEAEQNIEELFKTARAEPLSVVFIDEIEALVPRRRASQSSVMQRVVPQILAELEGFDSAERNPILFLGASNEPWSLDSAILRPGRFDERIYVGLPDLPARRKMLDIYMCGRPIDPGIDLDHIAERLDRHSGADIRNLCDKAASEAFLEAIERNVDTTIGEALLERLLGEVKPSVRPVDLARFAKYAEAMR